MKTKDYLISSLVPAKYNPRQIKENDFDQLKNSLKEFGAVDPAIINTNSERKNTIIGGHQRIKAAECLGWDKFPCVEVNLSEEKERELNIRLNKNTGEWDWDVLANEFEMADLQEWGFTTDDFSFLDAGSENEGLTDPDEVPEPPEEPKTKLGDIYQLGEHRLMCGDSTSIDAVEKLMDGEKADISFTSPPYNAGDNIRGHFYSNDDDDKTDEEYVQFLIDFTAICIEYSEFSFVNIQILESNKFAIIDYLHKFKTQIKDILIWNKTQYPPHINKGTFGCKWEYLLALSKNGKGRSFPCDWQGKYPNVIETENNSSNEFAKEHKAGFPIAFPLWIIEKMDFCDTVFDPFGGTGTTMIACENTDRTCYMMELDPKYCDVIVKRWEDFTGKKAVLNG